jgi:hypothetical protein
MKPKSPPEVVTVEPPGPITARVEIIEVAPDPDKIEQWAKEDPAAVSKIVVKQSVRLIEAKQSAESRKRTIEKHLNETNRQDARRRKSIAFKIADRLMQQDRTLGLPRKTSELARRVRREWPKYDSPTPELRTIRRWFS